ncbi:hypothetical protein [uncultured Anaerofustis sp.]|uniref:hypothetical protein n=1 Tax=uncultured Anaerofustis sp. TaxID=904996 RepID=UPI0025E7579A|nr:hypothetical protein [uncultured Anaerofustis sp.]
MDIYMILICFTVYVSLLLSAAFYSYKLGVKSGRDNGEEAKDKEKKKERDLKLFFGNKSTKMTKKEREELEKINIALNNIENYDGTRKGQREIR